MRVVAAVAPTELLDATDFTALSVVVPQDHVWLGRDELIALAGERADTAWVERLDGMLAYAATRGWLDDDGAVRAHIQWRS